MSPAGDVPGLIPMFFAWCRVLSQAAMARTSNTIIFLAALAVCLCVVSGASLPPILDFKTPITCPSVQAQFSLQDPAFHDV